MRTALFTTNTQRNTVQLLYGADQTAQLPARAWEQVDRKVCISPRIVICYRDFGRYKGVYEIYHRTKYPAFMLSYKIAAFIPAIYSSGMRDVLLQARKRGAL